MLGTASFAVDLFLYPMSGNFGVCSSNGLADIAAAPTHLPVHFAVDVPASSTAFTAATQPGCPTAGACTASASNAASSTAISATPASHAAAHPAAAAAAASAVTTSICSAAATACEFAATTRTSADAWCACEREHVPVPTEGAFLIVATLRPKGRQSHGGVHLSPSPGFVFPAGSN